MNEKQFKIYEIRLKSIGNITSLPDSQKIFGAIIHNFKNHHSDMEFYDRKNFVELKNNEESLKIMAISNLLPTNYLPNLYNWTEEKIKYTAKIKYKEGPENKFYFLNKTYKGLLNSYKSKSYIGTAGSIQHPKIIHTYRDMNNFMQISEGSGGVFSQNIVKVVEDEYTRKKLNSDLDYDFVFYIRSSSEKLKIKDKILKLGPRASRGFNLYQVIEQKELEELEEHNSKAFINIGMLGINNIEFIDLEVSTVKKYLSERKAYQYNQDNDVYSVDYIDAGSLIILKKTSQLEQIKIVEKIKDQRYLYTGGFMLPLEIEEYNE